MPTHLVNCIASLCELHASFVRWSHTLLRTRPKKQRKLDEANQLKARRLIRTHANGTLESEETRRARLRRQATARFERESHGRTMDEQKADGAPPHPVLQSLGIDTRSAHTQYTLEANAAVRWQHVEAYNDSLDSLSQLIFTCPCCKQRKLDHGKPLDDVRAFNNHNITHLHCSFCDANPDRLAPKNGLDLDLQGDKPWQRAWQELQSREGGSFAVSTLTPLEEALISPVLVQTAVLRLPSGRQLGWRASVITFSNPVATVARQLPRAQKIARLSSTWKRALITPTKWHAFARCILLHMF